MGSKLYSSSAIRNLTRRLQKQRKKIVFTNGCFDILHAGHVDYLEKAKRFGDFLILGLNSDHSTRRLKGPERPINHEKDRAKVLSALSCIDAVVIFDEDTPIKLIKAVKPNVLVKGADWSISDIAGAREVLSWGGQVKRIKLLEGRSTSSIVAKVKKNVSKKSSASH